MRFELDTACRGTHCASTPLPALHHQHHRLGSHLEETKGIETFRIQRETTVETNVVEGAKTVLRGEAGGPGMAYPAPATALNRHSPFSSSSATSIANTVQGNPNGHLTVTSGHLPAPAAPRPTDFSVSTLLTAANTHPPLLGGSSSQGSISPPPGGPGSPAAAPETPPPLSLQREISHNSSAVAAASYFGALAAAGFYNHTAHLPPVSSPSAHHLQSKAILAGSHHHPQFNPQALAHPGKFLCLISNIVFRGKKES